MNKVVNRGAANINAVFALFEGDELVLLTGQCVKNLH